MTAYEAEMWHDLFVMTGGAAAALAGLNFVAVYYGWILLTVTGIYAAAGPYAFDWNKTHIYNPDWPPHAKFHNARR